MEKKETKYILREAVVNYRNYKKIESRKIGSPADVVAWYKDLTSEVVEKFVCIYLNGQNEVVCFTEISGGWISVGPQVNIILRDSLLFNAPALIVLHNHPSGNPKPSPEDNNFTGELKEASKILQVKLLDSIITGQDGYYSYADEGKMV